MPRTFRPKVIVLALAVTLLATSAIVVPLVLIPAVFAADMDPDCGGG